MKRIQLLFTAALVLLASGCATSVGGLTHYTVDQHQVDDQLFEQVLVIPVDATVYELGIASLEEVPEWSEQSRQVMQAQLDTLFANDFKIQLATMPALSAEEKLALDEHVAVYRQVVQALRAHQGTPGWQHKKTRIAGTIGSGLEFLNVKTGADVAMLVSGIDVKSSGGRMLAAGFAAVAGVGIPMGHSEVVVGYVNLHNGDVLWSNQSFSTTQGLTSSSDVKSLLHTAFGGHNQFLAKLDTPESEAR